MTTEEARSFCRSFDVLKRAGRSDDEIWAILFEGLTNEEIIEVIDMSLIILQERIAEALADGDDPRMLWHIFTEFIT